jgi:hypothetical protein
VRWTTRRLCRLRRRGERLCWMMRKKIKLRGWR